MARLARATPEHMPARATRFNAANDNLAIRLAFTPSPAGNASLIVSQTSYDPLNRPICTAEVSVRA